MVVGLGIASHDVKPDSWTRVYGCVTGIYTGGEQEALTALRLYQKQLRHHTAVQDEMIMLNTWGDRSQDAKIDEAFCLAELDRAARMGITLFQLDDGWQSGKALTRRLPEVVLRISGKVAITGRPTPQSSLMG